MPLHRSVQWPQEWFSAAGGPAAHRMRGALALHPSGELLVGLGNKLLAYDGRQWRRLGELPAELNILCLHTASDGAVYVGADEDLGVFRPKPQGAYQYHSLRGELDLINAQIHQLEPLAGGVLFVGGRQVYWFPQGAPDSRQAESNKQAGHSPQANPLFPDAVRLRGVVASEQGVWVMTHEQDWLFDGKGLNKTELTGELAHALRWRTRSAAGPQLMGDTEGRIWLRTETGLQAWNSALAGKLRRYGPLIQAAATQQGWVFATASRGLLHADPNRSELTAWNRQLGLASDTLWDLLALPEGGVACLHPQGLTLLHTQAPLNDWSALTNLNSPLHRIAPSKHGWWLGAESGLYELAPGAGDSQLLLALQDKNSLTGPEQRILKRLLNQADQEQAQQADQQPWGAVRVAGFRGKVQDLARVADEVLVGAFNQLAVVQDRKVVQRLPVHVRKILPAQRHSGYVYLRQTETLGALKRVDGEWRYLGRLGDVQESLLDWAETPRGDLFVLGEKSLYRLALSQRFTKNPALQTWSLPQRAKAADGLVRLEQEWLVRLQGGLYRLQGESLQPVELNTPLLQILANAQEVLPVTSGMWARQGKRLYRLYPETNQVDTLPWLDLLPGAWQAWAPQGDFGLTAAIGGSLYHLRSGGRSAMPDSRPFHTQIRSLQLNNQAAPPSALQQQQLSVEAGSYTLLFDLVTPHLLGGGALTYEVRVGEAGEWLQLEQSRFPVSLDRHGEYSYTFRARDPLGRYSQPASFQFHIQTPWYLAWTTWLAAAGLVLLLILLGVRLRERNLRRRSAELEKQVKERTQAIEQANYHLSKQKAELESKTRQLAENLETIGKQQKVIVENEKLAALGQLVANVAHELNTPIGSIRSTAHTMAENLPASLRQLLALLPHLPPAVRTPFADLLEQVLHPQASRSARQERALREQLATDLQQAGVQQADDMAYRLAKCGVEPPIQPWLPILQAPQAAQLLELAAQLGSLHRNVRVLQNASDKTQKTVFALKNYAFRTSQDEPVVFQVADTLDNILLIYENRLRQGVTVDRDYQPVPALYGYPEAMGQIWTNLLDNSLHALQGKGHIRLRVRPDDQRPAWVEVQFEDDGPGIPQEVLPHIFEQFYTTKGRGEGTGLGLHIVKGIVEEHGGEISVQSQPGHTRFLVRLPVDNPLRKRQQQAAPGSGEDAARRSGSTNTSLDGPAAHPSSSLLSANL